MINQATSKISPHVTLTAEQSALVEQVLMFTQQHIDDDNCAVFVITGDAGTGKSVILSQLFYRLQKMAHHDSNSPLYQTENYFLVNHPELLKVYREIAGKNDQLLKKQFQRPTSLINKLNRERKQFDIGIIDEAHLLLSQPDHYNNFYGTNQLSELLKLSRVLIIVFDSRQVLRMKTFWDETRLRQLLAPYQQTWYHLDHQFRMQADPAVIKWIDHFTTDGYLYPITDRFSTNYDFRVFDQAERMRQAIVNQNERYGLSRIVSTTGYPSTLDGGEHYIKEGKFKMPWDQYNYTSTPWAEIPDTINEVGSIYTCQGFDLNYVGLILGPPVSLSEDGQRVVINTEKNTDPVLFKNLPSDMEAGHIETIKGELIQNSINVLMKRGIKGLYIYAHDSRLRDKLLKIQANKEDVT